MAPYEFDLSSSANLYYQGRTDECLAFIGMSQITIQPGGYEEARHRRKWQTHRLVSALVQRSKVE